MVWLRSPFLRCALIAGVLGGVTLSPIQALAQSDLRSADAVPERARDDAVRTERRAIRRIAPGSITPDFDLDSFERVEPLVGETRSRLSRPGDVQEAPPAPVRRVTLYNPVVRSAGSIEAGPWHVTLAEVDTPALDAICGADRSPCGRRARTALRMMVRGRDLVCEVPEALRPEAGELVRRMERRQEIGEGIEMTSRCTVGRADLGEWLVAQGWAEPKAGESASNR